MFLKSIEVQGFKSFANKMTFSFGSGITGIVGPNGSGKSNIADAVRWVLGEQSARQLRGSKMEDVIFAGTENRKPLGFAYVSITLDNSDHYIPSDYDTITVSRRVYRSGESEYRINGRNCRLRDIQEMFFDTGIGKEGYSIIGQGQIDKILSGKPEDRRELFDEAVGIVKYKKRKKLTEKNLEEERQNLSRVKDILYELEKQLAPLAKQSEKARAYLDLRDRLKSLDANMYLISFEKIREESVQIAEKIQIAQSQLSGLNTEFEEIKASYTEIESLMTRYEEEITRLQDTIQTLAVEKQRLEGEDRLLIARREAVQTRISQSGERTKQLKKKIESRDLELTGYRESMQRLDRKEQELLTQQTRLEEKLLDISARAEACKQTISDLNAQIIQNIRSEADLKGHIERNDAVREQLQQRRADLLAQMLSVQSEADNEDSLTSAFGLELEEIRAQLTEIQKEEQTYGEELRKSQAKLTHNRIHLSEKERSYHEQSARYQTLKSVTERYDGYAYGVRRVMELKKKNPGIIGVVADILTVEKKYETAIETALGGSISNIVAQDEKAAKDMIRILKKEKAGRATFLPLSSIRADRSSQEAKICAEDGVIGVADSLVKTKKEYRHLAAHLLGRVFVTGNVDQALALAKKYQHSLRIVTLDGELLTPGGAISGGAYKNQGGLLGRRREMEELKISCSSLEKEINDSKKEIAALEKSVLKIQEKAEKIAEKKNACSMRENTVQIRMKQVSDSKVSHDRVLSGIRSEIEEIDRQGKENENRGSSLQEDITRSASDRQAAQDAIAEKNVLLEQIEAEDAQHRQEEHALSLQLAQLEQERGFLTEKTAAAETDRRELQTEYESGLGTGENAGQELASVEEDILANQTEMGKITGQMQAQSAHLTQIRKDREKYAAEHKTFFDRREEISDQISLLDKELFRLESQKEKNDDSRTQLSEYMWEEYKLTWNQCAQYQTEELAALSLTALRRMISEVKGEIRELGSVNVNAIDDYKSVSLRYQEMKEQYDDLVQAEEKLTGIISGLNRSMEKQFEENFARICVEFDRVFKLLFGGGKGTLSLTDPDNLLETGILITAQPPGKKLQNMMQLSGGEKALTAIAILFAIQNLKPSPFCLLDEIEAALDDSNVKRFAEYLHNLTKHTQFIVITHRRGTMKAADVLYGITMQEKGVSALVSVDFVEADLK